jgi:hypothetical protein
MDLHQIQISFQPNEDRILYRASFKGDDGALQEIRAWLTRRMVRALWSGIIDSLKTQIKLDKPMAAHASAEIVSMEYHTNIAVMKESGSFGSSYESIVQTYPLGEAPLLVTTANFTANPNQPLCINFVSDSGKGFEIAFSSRILHGFCKLLMEAVDKAEWNLNLILPGEALLPRTSATLN